MYSFLGLPVISLEGLAIMCNAEESHFVKQSRPQVSPPVTLMEDGKPGYASLGTTLPSHLSIYPE
jgi:hypothetical protein